MKQVPSDMASMPLPVTDRRSTALADYIELTKPRLNFLVVVTSAAGYYLGAAGVPDGLPLVPTSIGTALVAGGAAVLNQVYERDTDALMRRTRTRPLPDGRIASGDATRFGVAMAAAGLGMLAVFANLLATLLAVLTLLIYLAVYTPLKRRTSLATLIGAVPGAIPPLIGWAASNGRVSIGGLALFAIVFLWQIPHFMAIAWLYRDDYGKAGFPLLPVVEPDGRRAGRQAVLYAAALIPVSLVPGATQLAGNLYVITATALGFALLASAISFAQNRNDTSARRLFYGSITYLPLIWIAMILSKR